MKSTLAVLPALVALPFWTTGTTSPRVDAPGEPDPGRALCALLPDSTVACADAAGLRPLLDAGLGHPLIAALLDSPIGDLVVERSGTKPEIALGALNLWAGRPVLPALAALTRDGGVFGVALRAGRPAVGLVARGDAAAWREVVELVLTRVAEESGPNARKMLEPRRRVGGMDVWSIAGGAGCALGEGLFVASNDDGLLAEMLELAARAEPGGLHAREDFRAAWEAPREDGSLAWAWVDLAGLRSGGRPLAKLQRIAHAPAAHLVLGSTIAQLASAEQAVLEVSSDGPSLTLSLAGLGVASSGRELLAEVGAAAPPLPAAVAGEAGGGACSTGTSPASSGTGSSSSRASCSHASPKRPPTWPCSSRAWT